MNKISTPESCLSIMLTSLASIGYWFLIVYLLSKVNWLSSESSHWRLKDLMSVVLADYIIVMIVGNVFCNGFFSISSQIANRELTSRLLYPVSMVWNTGMRWIDMSFLPLVIISGIIFIFLNYQNGTGFWLKLPCIFLLSSISVYATFLLLASLVFWVPSVNNPHFLFFGTQFYRVAPSFLLSNAAPLILMSLLPLILNTMIPLLNSEAISYPSLILSAFLASAALLTLALLFWRCGLSHYRNGEMGKKKGVIDAN